MHILRANERTILSAEDISEMMSPIKDARPRSGFNRLLSSLPFFSKMFTLSSWAELIRGCRAEKINEAYVRELLASYDVENLRFRCAARRPTGI